LNVVNEYKTLEALVFFFFLEFSTIYNLRDLLVVVVVLMQATTKRRVSRTRVCFLMDDDDGDGGDVSYSSCGGDV